MPFRIIYLDDESDLLQVFADTFSAPDIEIEIYTDPKQAIAAVEAKAPDLLVLDYRLPGTTGDIIAQNVDAGIPKALITGDLEVKPVANFTKIFKKPYEADEMQEFIDSYRHQKAA